MRVLREDSSHFDLSGAIGALIRETEHMSHCIVDSRIGPLPENLPVLHKRILFQALQEGLSSGLKHGAARVFHLRISADPGTIRLRLSSDAKAVPSEPDLAISVVMNRAAKLGGTLRLDAAPTGSVLTLSLPY